MRTKARAGNDSGFFVGDCPVTYPNPLHGAEWDRTMSVADLKFKATLWAIRHLKGVETPDNIISSARSDYDTYWIFLRHREETDGEGEKAEPESLEAERQFYTRYCVRGATESKLIIQETKKSEHDKGSAQEHASKEFVEASSFEITHYYKEQSFIFRSPVAAALCRISRLYFLWWLAVYFVKRAFGVYASIFIRAVKERYAVIDVIIAMEDEGRRGVSFVEIAGRLHGYHYFKAGKSKIHSIHRKLSRLLDSLIETGELRRSGSVGYSATPKAVVSSIQWKREVKQSRHRAIMDTCMVLFTAILAISSVQQAMSGSKTAEEPAYSRNNVTFSGVKHDGAPLRGQINQLKGGFMPNEFDDRKVNEEETAEERKRREFIEELKEDFKSVDRGDPGDAR